MYVNFSNTFLVCMWVCGAALNPHHRCWAHSGTPPGCFQLRRSWYELFPALGGISFGGNIEGIAHHSAAAERGIHCDGSLKGSINTKLHHKTHNKEYANSKHFPHKLNKIHYPQLVRETQIVIDLLRRRKEKICVSISKKQFGCDNLYCKLFSIYVLRQQSNVQKNAQDYWWELHWDIKWPEHRDKEADFCWSNSWIWLVDLQYTDQTFTFLMLQLSNKEAVI